MDEDERKLRQKESSRKYYLNKKEERQKYNREYNQKNKDKIRKYHRDYLAANPEKGMLNNARLRAKTKGLDFNIDLDDVIIPEVCPLLGIEIHRGDGKLCQNSPSLDRFDSSKGYIKGNVWVISHRANTIKSNLCFHEFETIYKNWKEKFYGQR